MADLIFISLFLLISIAMIVLSQVVKAGIKKNCTVEVEAVAESRNMHHSYGSNHNYTVNIYGYDYNGIHYTASAKTRLDKIKTGSKQKIMIDPEDPQKCYRKQDLLLPRFLLFIGIMMLCVSVFCEIKAITELIN